MGSQRGARRSPTVRESSKSYVFYPVFCLLGVCGLCDSKRGVEVSRTVQRGPWDSQDKPQRA
eukprot:9384821-Pyramimonas_sp.AAC.1